MDLQSILDASDSSDEGFHEGGSSYRYGGDASDTVDIEQILRESDDEEDGLDDNFDPVSLRLTEGRNITADDILKGALGGTGSDGVNGRPKTNGNHSHTASDWAILQSILLSDDEEEKDDEWLNASANSQAMAFSKQSYDATRDPLLLVNEENDNGDSEIETNLGLSVEIPPLPSILDPSFPTTNGSANAVASGQGAVPMSKGSATRISFYTPSHEKEELKQQVAKECADDLREEETSRRAQAYAHSYEQKLLKAGRRDMVSPLRVKRRLKQKIELTARGEVSESQNAGRISSLSVTRIGSSGIVENKTMTAVSSSLEKHSADGAKVFCGLPTCLAFNNKFIAVGTQRGIILVYDLFEVLRQRLGATYDDNTSALKAGSITSLDLSFNGEAIIAGHSSGMIVMWDTIRGVVLRAVSDAHVSPIACVRFLNELKVVTVDVSGLVNKLTFAKNMLWANYSLETECLLDGTAGQILAMNVLPSYSTVKPQLRPDALTPFLRRITLIALSSERSSFAVAVDPQINVLHRWARPPADKISALSSPDDASTAANYLPCLSWGWGLVAGGGNKVMPILARAWGCCLQLLRASFPTLLEDATPSPGTEQIHWPAFGVHKEIDSEKPIVAVEWLDDRSLMYLTLTNEFTLVDTVMMTLLERLDFSGLRLVYAEFSLSRAAANPEDADIESTAPSTTFQNSIRYSDDRLLVLCKNELKCISIVGARRRISSLEEDGEWLEALALALDYYESAVISQEDRKRDQSGVKDLSRHPDLFRAKADEEEWLSKLLIRYLNLAIENAPEALAMASYSQGGNDLAHSHFQMLAGVCIEFCVVTRKAELLFGSIFQRFQAAGYTSVFLDVLEPYVLNDKLPYIGAEAMSFFVEHCKAVNDIATVERCLLHMDCSIMDFDTILSLLRKNSMYTALFYVYNNGLNDFITPLEIILENLFDEADAGSVSTQRRADGVPLRDFESLGYKALLYLKTCFSGKSFPREHMITPEDRRQAARRELLSFLIQEKFSDPPHVRNRGTIGGHRALEYPYMRIFLLVDARGLFDTLSLALETPEHHFAPGRSESIDDWVQSGNENDRVRMASDQEVFQVLGSILRPNTPVFDASSLASPGSTNAFLDFAAKYIMKGSVTADRDTTYLILNRMSNLFAVASDSDARQRAQKKAMDLLSASPSEAYYPDRILDVINRAGMHRAALLLHQQVASSWKMDSSTDIELRSKHFQSAIDCYIGDEDPDFRTEVYAYVKKECSGVGKREESGDQPATLRDALFTKLTALCRLSALRTASLVADLFVDDLDHVVDSLEACDEDQFNFLHVIASGDLLQSDPVAGSVLVLKMEHHQTYLALMAKLHPEMVYDYLSTHDNYRTQECLALCEEYDIPDATVYLLERTDKINEALRLGLQTLESRMMDLKRTVRGMEIDSLQKENKSRRGVRGGEEPLLPNKQDRALDSLKRMLTVVLDVCERKSHAHGSKLWFTVLDRLITAKGFLRLSKEQPQHARVMAGVLSDLLRLTMQRMVSSVPLTDLVHKVTTHNSGSNLDELREMVESLLGTYNFELKVFQGAARAFHEDVHSMMTEYRHLSVQGAHVESVMNHPLTQGTSADVSGMRRLPANRDATLRIGGNKNAAFVHLNRLSYSQKAESGLSNALGRLRERRTAKDTRGRFSLNKIPTVGEHIEGEPVVSHPRPVRALGEAEHRGRFMLFE